MNTILSVCSARPNFVKLAAVHHACMNGGFAETLKHVIVHTGQHYDPLLSDIFFTQLQIPQPDFNLGIKGGSDRTSVIDATAASLLPVLKDVKPNVVLVYGDVNGALGAARAAKQCGLHVAHIEAGLRSFDRDMPEELNRIEIDNIADLLFVSEQSGIEHLKAENVRGKAVLVGNTMIDTLLRMLPVIEHELLPAYAKNPFAVATLHRPSNVDTKEALVANLAFLGQVAVHCPVILPVHHRTKAALQAFGLLEHLPPRLSIVDPLGYIPFLRLARDAAFIMTDSGGIQEEAVLLRKRCFTLRKNTERPSTIESGSNVLIDLQNTKDVAAVLQFASKPQDPKIHIPSLWDGKAGERILMSIAGQ